ncbi:hypothetical protein C2S52_015793 [Perilla frutescens var. hirtella]|nr:hypothetical protein C2S52_015793 [Perilla frutescens var. hirtella]
MTEIQQIKTVDSINTKIYWIKNKFISRENLEESAWKNYAYLRPIRWEARRKSSKPPASEFFFRFERGMQTSALSIGPRSHLLAITYICYELLTDRFLLGTPNSVRFLLETLFAFNIDSSTSNVNAMLCGKSGSSWLDRLRTAKGFPVDTVSDLENFIQNPNSQPLETPPPKSNAVSICAPTQNENNQLFNIVSDVLNELFYFGDKCSNATNFKKSARKQANPRICAFSSNGSRDNSNAVPGKVTLLRSGDSNSGVEEVKVLDRWETEGEGIGRDASLVGFSRTEVTVIDTSYESWKFDKLLFRKKNVWKVRDKKGKGEIVGSKKKRKMEEDHQHGGKKWKVDNKEGGGDQCALPPLNEVYHQTNTSEGHDKPSNKVEGTHKKKQSDLTLESGSSSVILIKSIHAGHDKVEDAKVIKQLTSLDAIIIHGILAYSVPQSAPTLTKQSNIFKNCLQPLHICVFWVARPTALVISGVQIRDFSVMGSATPKRSVRSYCLPGIDCLPC